MVLEPDTFHKLHPPVVSTGLVVIEHASHELRPGHPWNVQGDSFFLDMLLIAPIFEFIRYHQAFLGDKARENLTM